MSLDGLRAWIGEVERKLGVRTKVMLALAAIAIGLGGAAMYLAIDTRDTAVSEGDVQKLQEELEARIGGGGGSSGLSQLESELRELKADVKRIEGSKGGSSGGSGGSGSSSGGAGGSSNLPLTPGDVTDNLRELNEEAEKQLGK